MKPSGLFVRILIIADLKSELEGKSAGPIVETKEGSLHRTMSGVLASDALVVMNEGSVLATIKLVVRDA